MKVIGFPVHVVRKVACLFGTQTRNSFYKVFHTTSSHSLTNPHSQNLLNKFPKAECANQIERHVRAIKFEDAICSIFKMEMLGEVSLFKNMEMTHRI